jgi:hypothetical protein
MYDQSMEPTLSPHMILESSCNSLVHYAWDYKTRWTLNVTGVGFVRALGFAMEVWVALTRANHQSSTNNGPDWLRVSCSHSETTGKGILMLTELAGRHRPAQASLAIIQDMFARYDEPLATFTYTQGTQVTILADGSTIVSP